jgi:two-component sensor histidine kinase
MQIFRTDDVKTSTVLTDIQNRVKAMGFAHEHLYRTDNLSKIDIAEYIENITAELVQNYQSDETHLALQLNLASEKCTIEQAIPCGLILNELVTNAIKHAFPRRQDKELHISFQRISSKYELIVKDNGVGLPKDFNITKTNSMGLKIVQMFVSQIHGQLEVNSESGAFFKIIF